MVMLGQKIDILSDIEENIMEKEENAGSQHFLLFSQRFQKPFPST